MTDLTSAMNQIVPSTIEQIPTVDQAGKVLRPLPSIVDAASFLKEKITEPPQLIEGVLHQGSKLCVAGGSKSYKTFFLLDMGLSVATGTNWLGMRVTQGRVLYVNLELQNFAIHHRVTSIIHHRQLELPSDTLSLWNLRGFGTDYSTLEERIWEHVEGKGYVLIILDPIYKLYGNRVENSVEDMANLLNGFEALAVRTGAAVAFGTHHSKGNQSGKEAIDRASGSGVFARDPDALIDLTRHEEEGAFTVTMTLRNFTPKKPFCVRWDHPLMQVAEDLDPKRLRVPGRTSCKIEPQDQEVMELFPKRWGKDPREGLLSSAQLREAFGSKGFDTSGMVAIRQRLVDSGELGLITNLPRNQTLCGRPDAVDAFEKKRSSSRKSRSNCNQSFSRN